MKLDCLEQKKLCFSKETTYVKIYISLGSSDSLKLFLLSKVERKIFYHSMTIKFYDTMIRFHMGCIGSENNGKLFLEELFSKGSPCGVESSESVEMLSHKLCHHFTNTLARSISSDIQWRSKCGSWLICLRIP